MMKRRRYGETGWDDVRRWRRGPPLGPGEWTVDRAVVAMKEDALASVSGCEAGGGAGEGGREGKDTVHKTWMR